MPRKLQREPTLLDIMAAALRAHTELTAHGDWGMVYVIFMDVNRTTRAVQHGDGPPVQFSLHRIQYSSPIAEEQDDLKLTLDAYNDCALELRAALRKGWRPICIQVLPFAEARTIPLRVIEPGSDDEAVIAGLMEEV